MVVVGQRQRTDSRVQLVPIGERDRPVGVVVFGLEHLAGGHPFDEVAIAHRFAGFAREQHAEAHQRQQRGEGNPHGVTRNAARRRLAGTVGAVVVADRRRGWGRGRVRRHKVRVDGGWPATDVGPVRVAWARCQAPRMKRVLRLRCDYEPSMCPPRLRSECRHDLVVRLQQPAGLA